MHHFTPLKLNNALSSLSVAPDTTYLFKKVTNGKLVFWNVEVLHKNCGIALERPHLKLTQILTIIWVYVCVCVHVSVCVCGG